MFDRVFDRAAKSAALAVLLIVAISLNGCGGLNPDQKTALATALAQAKDRSVSFAAISPSLAPLDAKNQSTVANWIVAHQNGLNHQAAALGNLQNAVNTGAGLSQQVKDELNAACTTAQMRVQTFKAMVPFLALTPSQSTWADAHAAQLQKLADDLTDFSNKLAKKTTTPNAAIKPATPAPAGSESAK